MFLIAGIICAIVVSANAGKNLNFKFWVLFYSDSQHKKFLSSPKISTLKTWTFKSTKNKVGKSPVFELNRCSPTWWRLKLNLVSRELAIYYLLQCCSHELWLLRIVMNIWVLRILKFMNAIWRLLKFWSRQKIYNLKMFWRRQHADFVLIYKFLMISFQPTALLLLQVREFTTKIHIKVKVTVQIILMLTTTQVTRAQEVIPTTSPPRIPTHFKHNSNSILINYLLIMLSMHHLSFIRDSKIL